MKQATILNGTDAQNRAAIARNVKSRSQRKKALKKYNANNKFNAMIQAFEADSLAMDVSCVLVR